MLIVHLKKLKILVQNVVSETLPILHKKMYLLPNNLINAKRLHQSL